METANGHLIYNEKNINFIEWGGREGATSNDSIKVEQSVNHSYKHYLIILSNR